MGRNHNEDAQIISLLRVTGIVICLMMMALVCSATIRYVPSQYATIQAAIDASSDGDEIIVSPGTYYENINFSGKNIILRSSDPTNPAIVDATVIDGGSFDTVVTFLGAEISTCTLSGFTITNGNAVEGGGGINGNGTLATIQYNDIVANVAEINGGGLLNCDGVIQNNTISDNQTLAEIVPPDYYCGLAGGGGLSLCDGIIQNNVISNNWVAGNGGGLLSCYGTTTDNIISGNRSATDIGGGGGLCDCGSTITRNIIYNNSAYGGGGLFLCFQTIENNIISGNRAGFAGGGMAGCGIGSPPRTNSYAYMRNNVISNNTAEVYGGGIFHGVGSLENNVIYGNSAGNTGGGIFCFNVSSGNGPVINNIVWANTAPIGAQVYFVNPTPDYCCIQDWVGGGVGNISSNPKLLDEYAGLFSLGYDSPCIDAGDPDSLYNDGCRPPGLGSERNDIGAYGGPWNCDWLTTAGCIRLTDYDFDSSTDGWNFSTLTGYSLPTSSSIGGMLGLSSPHDNQSHFGFWQTLPGVIIWEPGQVYRARCAVQTDQIDPTSIPTIRLRFTTEHFTGSAAHSITSLQSCSYSAPTSGTKEYSLFYLPATPDDLGLAFDMLDFDSMEWGSIKLDSAIIEKFSRPLFAGTLIKMYDSESDFAAWGWSANFGNPSWGGCTSGRSGGTISIRSDRQPQAAFWQSPANDLTYVADKLYRALFTMSRAASNTAATMPWCRIRCFNEDGQMSQELNINNGFSGIAMPPETPATRNYAVYWQTPDLPAGPTTDEDGFRIAVDMLNFGAGETGTYILDAVTVEYSDIPAYSTP